MFWMACIGKGERAQYLTGNASFFIGVFLILLNMDRLGFMLRLIWYVHHQLRRFFPSALPCPRCGRPFATLMSYRRARRARPHAGSAPRARLGKWSSFLLLSLARIPKVVFLSVFIMASFLLISQLPSVSAAFTDYGSSSIGPASSRFQVKVNGVPVHVYKTQIGIDLDGHNYVHIAIDGPVTVEVITSDIPETVFIGPERFGITHTMTGSKSFSFVINEPHQYVVFTKNIQLDGHAYGLEKYNLFIFAEPMETGKPTLGGTNVINAKNYGSIQAAIDACPTSGTVYFPAGTYQYSQGISIKKSDCDIYLEPGAYWKDIGTSTGWRVSIYKVNNVNLFGRGTIDVLGSLVVRNSSSVTIKDIVKRNIAVFSVPPYYWGSCMEIIDSDHVTLDNVKSLGTMSHVGPGYPEATAHDGIRLRSCQDSVVKNSFSCASDDPFHVVANAEEDSVDVTITDSVALGLAAQAYWGSVLNDRFPSLQTDRVSFINNDVFAGRITIVTGSTHNPDLLWKDVNIDISHNQAFIDIGGIEGDYRFSDTLDATIENLRVARIYPDKSSFIGFYVKGNPNVPQQTVRFKNLWVSGKYIRSLQDLRDLGLTNIVAQDMNIIFEVTESGDCASMGGSCCSLQCTGTVKTASDCASCCVGTCSAVATCAIRGGTCCQQGSCSGSSLGTFSDCSGVCCSSSCLTTCASKGGTCCASGSCSGTNLGASSDCSGVCCSKQCGGNLVGYWKMGGADVSNGLLLDHSGRGNHLTVRGRPAPETGVSGEGLKLKGDYFSHVDGADFRSPQMTFAIWIKPDTALEGTSRGVAAKAQDGAGWSWQLRYGNIPGFLGFQGNDVTKGSTWAYLDSGVKQGSWTFVAARKNSTHLTVFSDGRAVKMAASGGMQESSSNFYLGFEGWGGNTFNGTMDEARLYDYALSDQDILALYRKDVCRGGDPDGDGTVELSEVLSHISSWKGQELGMVEVVTYIKSWKYGC